MARRYEVCSLLQEHKIHCAIWFEDALGHYGVPTVVFDLYLLVPDIETTAEILQQHGWQTAPRHERDEFGFLEDTPMLKVPLRYFRMIPPDWDKEKEERTVLMPACTWNITEEQLLQTATGPDRFTPALPMLLDSLIDAWLDAGAHKDERLLGHLGMQIGYIYGYVSQVKDPSFAEQLRPEHCQFHLDCLAERGVGTLPFLNRHRLVRERLLNGQYVWIVFAGYLKRRVCKLTGFLCRSIHLRYTSCQTPYSSSSTTVSAHILKQLTHPKLCLIHELSMQWMGKLDPSLVALAHDIYRLLVRSRIRARPQNPWLSGWRQRQILKPPIY